MNGRRRSCCSRSLVEAGQAPGPKPRSAAEGLSAYLTMMMRTSRRSPDGDDEEEDGEAPATQDRGKRSAPAPSKRRKGAADDDQVAYNCVVCDTARVYWPQGAV